MNNGEIASLVSIAGMVLTGLGISGVDSGMLTGAANGLVAIVTIIAAVWSWYAHRKNAAVPGVTH